MPANESLVRPVNERLVRTVRMRPRRGGVYLEASAEFEAVPVPEKSSRGVSSKPSRDELEALTVPVLWKYIGANKIKRPERGRGVGDKVLKDDLIDAILES